MTGLTYYIDTVYKGSWQGSFLFLNGKPNVAVLVSAQSKKLIIDLSTKVYTGVVVINTMTSKELTLDAKYEVIVS